VNDRRWKEKKKTGHARVSGKKFAADGDWEISASVQSKEKRGALQIVTPREKGVKGSAKDALVAL